MPQLLLMLIIFMPIVCGVGILTLRPFGSSYFKPITAGATILTFMMVLYLGLMYPTAAITLSNLHPTFSLALQLDNMGILFTSLVSLLWVFTTFYTFGYMDHEKNHTRFYGFFIIALGVTLGIGFSANLFTLYMFYEALTFVTYPLVVHKGSKEALTAGKKYLIFSLFGAGLALTGMILLAPVLDNYFFAAQGKVLLGAVGNGYLLMVFLMMFIGFGVKAAIFPLHSWLLGAMIAPTPVSALLHAVAVVKSGIFALTRVTYYIFGYNVVKEINIIPYLSILIGVMIIVGSLLAVGEKNLKRRLAYSTIAQLGYIMMGLILLTENSIRGGLIHIVNHAFIKITLFFCIGTIIFMTGKTSLKEINGIGKRMPITMGCFTVSAFSLMGIPPLNGFISKSHLVIGALDANMILHAVLFIGGAFLTASYLLPIVIAAFLKQPEPEELKSAVDGESIPEAGDDTSSLEPPKVMLVPIVTLTVCSFILGLFPGVVLNLINQIITTIL
ncbi:multisubunit sodium/proton antiporter, MrpD subunit [Natronincola peptidivorans]|uniref:Multisubunit sodium/proton antiporter, MrpD subunit n=1 Tax=Natronincola peptidivorans TaxID=426128 RepID=A0A1I0G3N0_9FIRM|nr:proton-conducting transporter membrane subunit [Natronincola peptidivorans]SET65516.1 multisubunit sodium/proton antiporter, MrpD subunit [Natronincola peptidivorans]